MLKKNKAGLVLSWGFFFFPLGQKEMAIQAAPILYSFVFRNKVLWVKLKPSLLVILLKSWNSATAIEQTTKITDNTAQVWITFKFKTQYIRTEKDHQQQCSPPEFTHEG